MKLIHSLCSAALALALGVSIARADETKLIFLSNGPAIYTSYTQLLAAEKPH